MREVSFAVEAGVCRSQEEIHQPYGAPICAIVHVSRECGMIGAAMRCIMSASGHESVDHTADLAIRAWAPDLHGLIEQAARGMLDLMLDDRPQPDQQRDIVGEGQSPEDLLID